MVSQSLPSRGHNSEEGDRWLLLLCPVHMLHALPTSWCRLLRVRCLVKCGMPDHE